jgi:hypothetical protein
MSRTKEVKQLLAMIATWQGWRIEEKASGWMVYPPDRTKSGVMIHGSPSDHRWLKNVMSELRKRGAPV